VWWREIQFVLTVFVATFWTRSTGWDHAASALGSGIGIAAPLMIGFGWLLSWLGIDVTQGAAGWALVPIVEELVKLLPVLLIAWLYRRRAGHSFNPSDWLMAGCAAGAGFALVENVELILNSTGALRDMSRQYGPHLGALYLIPGAWGIVGFVGHAAATGIVASGIGLSLAVRRRGPARRVAPLALLRGISAPWWTTAALAFAWVTAEHVLANFTVDSGSSFGRILGNGRLTPWLALPLWLLVVVVDLGHRREALARSAIFRTHFALIRAAWRGTSVVTRVTKLEIGRMFLTETRRLNAAAWATFDTRPN
jgi:RsiW-degrading membrane proteinase PrsW (M82 family)